MVKHSDVSEVTTCSCGRAVAIVPDALGTLTTCDACGALLFVQPRMVEPKFQPVALSAPPAQSAPRAAASILAVFPRERETATIAPPPPVQPAPKQKLNRPAEPAPVQPKPEPFKPVQSKLFQTKPVELKPVEPKPVRPLEPTPAIVPAPRHKCGICHAHIESEQLTSACPECGLVFHGDCWEANWGCSAYGCGQVNALRPADAKESVKIIEDVGEQWPWEYLLLGGSVLSLLIGTFMFGAPSVVIALGAAVMAVRGKGRRGVLALSGALAVVGLVVGIELSYFWWLGVAPFHWITR